MSKLSPWQCVICEKRFVVESLARHCEEQHLEDDE